MKSNQHYQEMINQGKSSEEIVSLYMRLMKEEFNELHDAIAEGDLRKIVKEACDLNIVCEPVTDNPPSYNTLIYANMMSSFSFGYITDLLVFKYKALRAIEVVVESNYSKLILEDELDDADYHFRSLGIDVEYRALDDGIYGAFSKKDQTAIVKGEEKFFAEGKLMKGPHYKPVDESTDFWEL